MFESRTEIIGWVLALLVIAVMGVLTFTGPYHKINKTQKAAVAMSHPKLTVQIVTDPKTIGAYKPPTVTLHVGDAVDFKNVSNLVHTVTADNNAFNSGDIQTGGKDWSFFANKAGTFKYYCIYHPLMKGTLVVQG